MKHEKLQQEFNEEYNSLICEHLDDIIEDAIMLYQCGLIGYEKLINTIFNHRQVFLDNYRFETKH